MNTLKPIRCDCYFIYKCPHCAAEHQSSYQEVNLISKILCCCGKLLLLTPMKGVKVIPDYEKVTVKSVANSISASGSIGNIKDVTPKQSRLTEQHEEIVKGLVKLGFRKFDAKKAVDKVVSCGIIEGETENELFNRCFNEARTGVRST